MPIIGLKQNPNISNLHAAVLIVGNLISSPIESNIMKTEVPDESTAVEFELPEYPIQVTEERQKQERRVSVYVNVLTNYIKFIVNWVNKHWVNLGRNH